MLKAAHKTLSTSFLGIIITIPFWFLLVLVYILSLLQLLNI